MSHRKTAWSQYAYWYEITRPAGERERVLSVRDPLRGSKACQFRIGVSTFLLSPAQKVTSGSPAPVSDRLSYFKAYRIVNRTPLNEELTLTNGMGPKSRMALKPIFLCFPVEEWHHAGHFPIMQADDCLIVYELKPCEHKATISTIDQFGLNELSVKSSDWLCVPADATETQGKGE